MGGAEQFMPVEHAGVGVGLLRPSCFTLLGDKDKPTHHDAITVHSCKLVLDRLRYVLLLLEYDTAVSF